MGRRTFSGREAVRVLVNPGGFKWRRTTRDHARLYYHYPTNEDDRRRVTVPLHDELRTGTLRSIAENAGAQDFDWNIRPSSRNVVQEPIKEDGKKEHEKTRYTNHTLI